jgi:N-acetyl-alpha-D-glucosaminyl L-malate synthase BshA
MKIGITCYPTYGGSGVVATELGKRLAERGFEVHFIAYALPYRLNVLSSNIFFHEVDVLQYPLFEYPPYSLSLASKMAEIVEHHNLDLLHVHYAIPHATSAFLAKNLLKDRDLKFITTLHGTDITILGSDPSFLKIAQFSIEESAGVTAVSSYLKEETQRVFDIKKEIEVIPNFIPFNITTPINKKELRKQFGDDDECIITHISNFRPVKRIADVIMTAEKVLKKKKIKLLMVGDGPDRFQAEEKCRQAKICDRVLFLGKQENIKEILSITDIVLLPSGSESFGLVALEAMAYGIPVVSTNAGGLPEVNINGETGFTLDVGDIDGFSEAILTILDDRKLASKMKENGARIAKENFSADIIIPQYINYYKKVLGG